MSENWEDKNKIVEVKLGQQITSSTEKKCSYTDASAFKLSQTNFINKVKIP